MKCINCGKTFKMKFRSSEKYCSTECRIQYYKKDKPKRKCRICGKELVGRKRSLCSPECRRKASIIATFESRKRDFENLKVEPPKPHKKPQLSISEINELARAEGLNYGQYVAKHGC